MKRDRVSFDAPANARRDALSMKRRKPDAGFRREALAKMKAHTLAGIWAKIWSILKLKQQGDEVL